MKIFINVILIMMGFLKGSDVYKVCTDDLKVLVDDVFGMVQSLEADNFNPDHAPFMHFTSSLDKFLKECAKVDVNVQDYNSCVENVLDVLPEVGHLVDSINRQNTSDIVLDLSRVLYGLVTGITLCLKDKQQDDVMSSITN